MPKRRKRVGKKGHSLVQIYAKCNMSQPSEILINVMHAVLREVRVDDFRRIQYCHLIVLTSFGKDIEFVDVPVGREVRVDILVGIDAYWKLMTPEIVFLPDGLVAQRSVLVWVLSDPLPAPTVAENQLCVPINFFAHTY